jgi:crotonobetainyl-CoA:carnitine CoA-transferase CaiB-like acyl-CoA transferase
MPGPLNGVRVIELGSMYAAPTAGRMLRDFGADVIKVEDPVGGDFARQWQPAVNGESIGFARLNSGKRSVGIDLRRVDGRELVKRLSRNADVVIESFRPGRLEKWNLCYEQLSADNPGLVLTRISGFGQTGPYRERPGFGTVAEVIAGYAFLNGWPDTPPTAPPFGFADSIAGISAAYGTAMALFQRSITGRGCEVDTALYEPLMFILGDAIMNYTSTGFISQRVGNSSGAASPRGIYQARDGGWLAIAASNQTIAMRLFDAMDRTDLKADPRYGTNIARMDNNISLQAIVSDWIKVRDRDEVLSILGQFEVVAAAVNDASDIARDPHFLERTLKPITDTTFGNALVPGPILHIEGYDGADYKGYPSVGENTRDVLVDELGLDTEELEALQAEGIVSPAASK